MAAILVAAQWGAMVHAFEHEAGKPPAQVCKICVAASQLGFACVDNPATTEASARYPVQAIDTVDGLDSLHVPVARQRGPPKSL